MIKPIGGAFDGSTGLSDNIPQADIVVMYHVIPKDSERNERKFVIRRGWFFSQDEEGLGKKMIVSCDLCGSGKEDSAPVDIRDMRSISPAEIDTSKALSLFVNIAKQHGGAHEKFYMYELCSKFLQDTYYRSYD